MTELDSKRVERFIWADDHSCGFFRAVCDYDPSNDLHMSIDTVIEGIPLSDLIKKCKNPQTLCR